MLASRQSLHHTATPCLGVIGIPRPGPTLDSNRSCRFCPESCDKFGERKFAHPARAAAANFLLSSLPFLPKENRSDEDIHTASK